MAVGSRRRIDDTQISSSYGRHELSMASPPPFVYQHYDTVLIVPAGETETDRDGQTVLSTGQATPLWTDVTLDIPPTPQKRGVFGHMVPLNKLAKDSLRRLALESERIDTEYHRNFLETTRTSEDPQASEPIYSYVLSLDRLPELPSIGWRIGRGRRKLRNMGVDLLLPTDDDNDNDIAGLHARLSWVKGGGGFFLIADNQRGMTVNLNGETLSYSQRLIPYNNTIGVGQYYFTIKFLERNPAEEEEFQSQLLLMYSAVLKESAPMIMPTPSRNEMRIGDWVVRKPIARGSFGHVSSVTHAHTGKLAAAKELWRTPQNSWSVDREVAICKALIQMSCERLAAPFEIYHEKVHNRVERNRIIALLDDTWRPGSNDAIDKYILYSPLATSNFYALITSDASREIRVELFAQILEGIAFLHDNGMSHRDIKPANLAVITFDPPQAKILDFGCATFSSRTMYDSPGTIPYLAPEQEKGKYHDRSVDYWAVGLVGLEVLGYKHRGRVDIDQFSKIRAWLEDFAQGRSTHPIATSSKAMLQWDPEHRMTAQEALSRHLSAHRYHMQNKEQKRFGIPIEREVKRDFGT